MDLSEDERVFVTAASGFVEKELRPAIAPFVREHRFPTPLVRTFPAGFMGTSYNPAYDGGGLGTRGAALLCELLSEAEPGFAAIYLCNSAPMTVLAKYGGAELKQRWLAPLCRGEMIASFGVTEPHSGSDVARNQDPRRRRTATISYSAVRRCSQQMSGTPLHGLSTIVAVTDSDLGPKGLSTFVVPVGTSGFSVGKAGKKIGWRIAN